MSPSPAPARGLRIVRLANFVAPASGGLRTALRELGAGYRAAGHDPVLVIPGERARCQEMEQGTVITLPGPLLPGTGGYRVLTDRRRLARVLERLAPDRLEVSDRTTLRWTGEWARRARIPAVMVSHETADGVLRTWGVPDGVARRVADALNSRTAWAYTRVVCTTEWAEREFVRIGARNVARAPLGVDLDDRHPGLADPGLRAAHARADELLLVLCSRLSVEKRPGTALDALAALRRRGVRARLVVAGDGPLRSRLEARAAQRRLPVAFLGHVADRGLLGALQASADVCLAPGPAETFGLAALEALACGTPVVVSASSALPGIVGSAGVAAADDGESFADAVCIVLERPEADRREAARTRAESFGWDTAVAAFLGAHDAEVRVRPAAAPEAGPASRTQAAAPVGGGARPGTAGPGHRAPARAGGGQARRPGAARSGSVRVPATGAREGAG
ncbi:GDP-mannose-dependent alpha-(1-6)-phosphatidylinositol dimannoside mannosyltransferase [Streptomyces sulfonofaciens]|uniref:GDP-mannose-dependent alpha-(1-6)-phosphatidylinositol dimannoside mannosyltransferase n=1 Tax=Streptomyces sulfonofaciens TaxID=68272 RepID=A0A919G204_9ACTN|nr:glycosyltransferase [Streptomyces sulfonofaciens]GHH76021.1 GDP-mannose-dependent alpha-(1-6)-phosphatidylinositol dimannoside mannosyltransferase [Streptomyces sulfonofaciens]